MKARAIAFYLPQYHPIPENDQWWGKGFTEWTNVAKAKPLFRGHWQPRLPADLGFYDLRVPEIREQQAELARYAGIEGFCYWHYWFGNGKRALERIFKEVVESGKPDFPFCLAWANESWTGRWHGLDSEIIFEQKYPGKKDYESHFYALLPAFKDPRYIEVDGKKLFIIYRPEEIPDLSEFINLWNKYALNNGFSGFFFVSANINFYNQKNNLLDGAFPRYLFDTMTRLPCNRLSKLIVKLGIFSGRRWSRICPKPFRCSYADFVDKWISKSLEENIFPCIFPNWDNTPRCQKNGTVLVDCTPQLFKILFESELEKILHRPFERRVIFIKSWNEWAEGNYLEPDQVYGKQYLDVMREILHSPTGI